jgi:imidazolonepropionase-like amidohydrolase
VRPAFATACLLAGLALLAPAGAQQAASEGETLYLKARVLYTGRLVLRDALVTIRGGKVVAVSPMDAPGVSIPAKAKVLERDVVAPGFVLTELQDGYRRTEESLGARYQVIDGFDPHGRGHPLLASGITTAFLHPGMNRLASGQGAVVKLGGPAEGRVLRDRAELCLSAGAGALGPPPRVKIPFPSSSDVPIEPSKAQRPSGRSGIIPELAAKLREALAYSQARLGPAAERPELDANLAALAEAVLDGRIRVEANRVDELRNLIRLLRELSLEPVISGGVESYKVLEELAGLGSGVVYRLPYGISPRGDSGEGPRSITPRWDTPRRLAEAGIPFAFAPRAGEAQDLRLGAALSVRGGLSASAALAAITRQAAQLLGVGERVGHLGVGADADFVVLSGEPLATATRVSETWIAGELVFDARAPKRGKRPARALVVRAGKIVTGAGPVIRDGAVLVVDGQIAAVGSSVPVPLGARVIDAGPEAVVTPGFVDAYGHFGLQGGSGRELEKAPLGKLLGEDRESTKRVARAGVTTAVVGGRTISRSGGRLGALKTLGTEELQGDFRRGFLLEEITASVIDLSREDPQGAPKGLMARLAAAKQAAAKWAKYRKALADWVKKRDAKKAKDREAQIKKRRPRVKKSKKGDAKDGAKKDDAKKDDAKKDDAKKDDAKKGDAKDGEKKIKKTKKFDPISGTWEFTISGGPLPEPREGGQMLLKLEPDGKTITGVAKPPGGTGDDAPISGTLNGKEVELNLEVDSPFGKPKIKGTLDGEDHMTAKLLLGPLALDVDATRIERSVPVIKIEIRRGKSKDGRPEPPAIPPAIDGFRLALEGKAPILVKVSHPGVALAVLDLAKKARFRVVFVDFADADLIADQLKAAGAGVLVRPESRSRADGGNLAAHLDAAGIPFAFMSQSGDGAEWLPLRVVGAVARGLDAGSALGALTNDAARLLGLSDRVGSLEVGKDGDLLIFNGSPMEATTRLERVFVRGREVPAEKE